MSMKKTGQKIKTAEPGDNTCPGDIPLAAIHEAGHAVAMVLAIGQLGYGTEEAIAHIEMRPDQSWITHEHMFSRDIDEASYAFKQAYISERGVPREADLHSFLTEVVRHGRAAGADIDPWFRAQRLSPYRAP